MISSIFIIHGSFGSPFENWFPSIYNSINSKGIRAYVPHFPSPLGQTFENWSKILDSYVDSNLLDANSLIVCHSSACPFILKYVKERGINIGGLITVSGFNNFYSGNADFDKINSEFFQESKDLTLAAKNFSFIHSFYSDNDPYISLEVLQEFNNLIDSKQHLILNAGHFNKDAGYITFNELLKLILFKVQEENKFLDIKE